MLYNSSKDNNDIYNCFAFYKLLFYLILVNRLSEGYTHLRDEKIEAKKFIDLLQVTWPWNVSITGWFPVSN